MNEKISTVDKWTIALLVLSVILGGFALILLAYNEKLLEDSEKNINKSVPSIPKKEEKKEEEETIDLTSKLKEIAAKYPNIEYTGAMPGYKSFVYKNDTGYDSIILDTKTGEELSFLNLIKSSRLDEFNIKEIELLSLKYPEFIVKGIKYSEGYKRYYVKEKEVIIYYYDYLYDYEITEPISLQIDYNEIKSYLKFEPILNKTYKNEDGYNYKSNKKAIALTFDDGPSRKYNPLILQELAKNKAHATFFMVGQMMNSCQNCILETYKSGNEIGSHTYEHMNIKKNSIEAVQNSLNKTDAIYNKVTGNHIKLLRPPYGAYNKDNLNNIDNAFVLWNLDTEDWRYRNVDHIVEYIKENAKDGSIILMHELYETSYEALKVILPWLYAEGYQVVSVSELASLKGRTLENNKAYLSFR